MVRFTVFNVGQAAASLLQLGPREYAIYDCGCCPVTGFNPVYLHLKKAIERDPKTRIVFMALSHLDLDHISGVSELLDDPAISSRLGLVYCNGIDFRTLRTALRHGLSRKAGHGANENLVRQLQALRSIARLTDQRALSATTIQHQELTSPAGHDVETYPIELKVPGLANRFRILVWGPSQRLKDRVTSSLASMDFSRGGLLESLSDGRPDWNSASIVMTIDFAGRRFCLAGDATAQTWQDILLRSQKSMGKSDVVLCWHHGGRLGTTRGENFDDVVWSTVTKKPVALVSHGCRNPYGHPHPDSIAAIRSVGGEVFCTQLKVARRRPPDEIAEAFASTGSALLVGDPLTASEYRLSDLMCCGDISVSVDHSGQIQSDARHRNAGDRHRHDGCCLFAHQNRH